MNGFGLRLCRAMEFLVHLPEYISENIHVRARAWKFREVTA